MGIGRVSGNMEEPHVRKDFEENLLEETRFSLEGRYENLGMVKRCEEK